MYPYRRGSKKRSRNGSGGAAGNPGGQPNRRGPQQQGGRRPPSSAQELLSVLQPTTKALAQVLAGNTRPSGQLASARNVLVHAERLVDERQVERMMPAQREDFLEQLARLKLTLADADAAFGHQDDDGEQPAVRPQQPQVGADRLREMALSLAVTTPPPPPQPPVHIAMEVEPQPAEPEPEPVLAAPDESTTTARGPRLRLKSTVITSR